MHNVGISPECPQLDKLGTWTRVSFHGCSGVDSVSLPGQVGVCGFSGVHFAPSDS